MLGKEHGGPWCGWLQSRDKRVVSFLYFLHWEQIIINIDQNYQLIGKNKLTKEKTARKFSCHLAMYFIVTRDFWRSTFASSLFSRRACQSKNKDNKGWINIICVYLVLGGIFKAIHVVRVSTWWKCGFLPLLRCSANWM